MQNNTNRLGRHTIRGHSPQIRKNVLVLRLLTERPEAVEAGFAKVVGTEKQPILKTIEEALENPKELPINSPYGDGDAAEKLSE